MPNKIIKYKCEHCGSLYDTEESAIDCLNNHNVIFMIETDIGDVDCWGRYDTDWAGTDILFKDYRQATSYVESHGDRKNRIAIIELQDMVKEQFNG